MAARKKAARKAPKKKAAAKASKKAAKKTAKKAAKAAKKKSAKKAASSKPTKTDAPAAKDAAQAASAKKAPSKGKVTAAEINLGHVFALRPPVAKSFRQENFRLAKQRLKDEAFESIEAAARAVAEKALELTHDGPKQHGGTRRKRH